MPERRTYTDEEVAGHLAALRANRGNVKKTAIQRGIPRGSLRAWAGLSGQNSTGTQRVVPVQAMDAARTKLADTFKSKAQALLDAVDPEKIAKASARDLLISAGIATEKAELLSGGPTSRTESVRISLVEPEILRNKGLSVIEGRKRTA